jgi:sigma-B regulation protein RsbU (phosphoserine phosphatase)
MSHQTSAKQYSFRPHARIMASYMTPATIAAKGFPMPKKPATLQYALFALLATAAIAFYIADAASQYTYIWHGHERAAAPVYFGPSNQVGHMTDPAQKAGLREGDRVLAVNGHPLRSFDTLLQQTNASRPGDPMTLMIERKDGSRGTIQFLLSPQVTGGKLTLSFRLFILTIQAVFPAFCLLIGLWVVAAKPRDPNAWYVLGIFGFIQCFFVNASYWNGPILPFMCVYADLAFIAFFLSMLLFGIYFPEPVGLDSRHPWAKWILIAPSLAFAALDVIIDLGRNVDFQISSWIPAWLHTLDHRTESAIAVICISLFFITLFPKYSTASTRDAKRRLGILVWGAELGLAPMFIGVVIGQIRNRTLQDAVPSWYFWTCFLLFIFFPLSMAYVIVVQRAMDVRILLRQGTQYALARGTLNAVRVILGTLLGVTLFQLVNHPQPSGTAKTWALVLALLFLALQFGGNRRLSAWIDRRFFREVYSTEQVLTELSEQAGRFTETRPLLETVTRRIADTLHVSQVGVLLQCPGGYCLEQSIGVAADRGASLPATSLAIRKLRSEKLPLTVYYDNPDGWLMLAGDSEQEALKRLSAEVLLPLPGRNDLIGVIALGPKRSEAPYSRSDLTLLRSVAAQTGLAIENSRLFSTLAAEAVIRERANREMEIAREVQRRLFPQTSPSVRGVDIAGHCRPALGIGGDYYDFIALDRASDGAAQTFSRLGIAVGDVSGKGISAALLMASLRASLRGQTLTGFDLAHLVHNVNLLLYDSSDSNRYATFFFAEYDPATRQLTYVNAGHNAPVILRRAGVAMAQSASSGSVQQPSGQSKGEGSATSDASVVSVVNTVPNRVSINGACEVLRLEEGGPVVGLLPEACYQQGVLTMEPGDVLLGYTDGISEAMNHADEEWGEDRMIAKAASCVHLSAQQMLESLFDGADRFASGAPQHDDMTLVLMKINDRGISDDM